MARNAAAIFVGALLGNVAVDRDVSAARADDRWNPFADRASEPGPARRETPARSRGGPEARDSSPATAPPADGWAPRARGNGLSADGRTTEGPSERAGIPGYAGDDTPLAASGVVRRELAPVIVEPQDDASARLPGGSGPQRAGAEAGPPDGDAGPLGSDGRLAVPFDHSGDRSVASPSGPQPVRATHERATLAPFWTTIDDASFQSLLSEVPPTPASPTLRSLWAAVLAADRMSPDVGVAKQVWRLAALHQSGFAQLIAVPGSRPSRTLDPSALEPDQLIAVSRYFVTDRAAWTEVCKTLRDLLGEQGRLPPGLQAESLVLGGVCAVRGGSISGAPIAASLAREAGSQRASTLALLERFGDGGGAAPVGASSLRGLDDLDLVLIEALGHSVEPAAAATARPAALALLATDPRYEPSIRIPAAEAAARANIITATDLAEAYDTAQAMRAGDPRTPALVRADLWRTLTENRALLQRARSIRAFLDLAAKDGLAVPAAGALARAVAELPRVAEIGWFAETAIEVLVAGQNPASARAWLDATRDFADDRGARLDHWRLLIDLSDLAVPTAVLARDIAPIDDLAGRGRVPADDLQRLVSVLDALGVQIPIPLWDRANQRPQPTTGFLPKTGMLRLLADAAEARDFGPLALLAMASLGPDGPSGANLLALTDTIRAFRKAGGEAQARGLAFEALYPIWPRIGQ